jgi:hypothetical protein
MTVKQLVDTLQLTPVHVAEGGTMEVENVYCGDLLSDVIANCPPDSVWFTVQGHVNVVAVADLRDVACVVVVNGIEPDAVAAAKAAQQDVSLCKTTATAADLIMKLAGKVRAG